MSRYPFSVSRYQRRVRPEVSDDEQAPGPILRARVQFERWFKEKRIEADAFIDPGADRTIMSARWITEQGGIRRRAKPRSQEISAGREEYVLLERATLEVGGVELSLGSNVSIVPSPSEAMPGYEDILLGRDFLARHGLLFVLDAQDSTFSILQPVDEDNRLRREQILRALDKKAPPAVVG